MPPARMCINHCMLLLQIHVRQQLKSSPGVLALVECQWVQYTLPIRMPLYRMYLIKEYDKEIPNRPRSRQRINLSDN